MREHAWNPLLWLPGEAIYLLLSRDTGPVEDRLLALGGRLEAVPERLASARATLRDMPRVHVETALSQISGLIGMLRDEVPPLAGTAPNRFLSVEPMRTAAEDALVEHRDWLLEQLEGANGDPRLGPSLFAAKLHLSLDSDLSAEQVAAAAREHLDRVTDEMTGLAVGWVGPGDDAVRRALDRAAAEAPDDRTIVSVARRWLAEATELVASSGVVRVPDDPMEIEVMPELRRGIGVAYCDAPGPLEEGGITRFAISPTPAGWSPERVASFYREYNTAMMANLTVHEAMPGHMVQLAHARRYRGATRVRQVLASGSFIEGWGVHAEEIMARLGYGGAPVRLQQLKTMLRTTINALLDAGVHAGGMSETEAIELMTDARLPGGGRGGRQVAAGAADQRAAVHLLRRLPGAGPHAGRPHPATTTCSRTAARRRGTCPPCSPRPGRRHREPRLTAGVRPACAASPSGPARRAGAVRLLDRGRQRHRRHRRSGGWRGARGVGPAGSAPDGAAPLVSLQRFGGIAGNRDEVTVQPDGSWRRTAQGRRRDDRQADRGRSRPAEPDGRRADAARRGRPYRAGVRLHGRVRLLTHRRIHPDRLAGLWPGNETPRDCESYGTIPAGKYQLRVMA